jgi:hypothetical protein
MQGFLFIHKFFFFYFLPLRPAEPRFFACASFFVFFFFIFLSRAKEKEGSPKGPSRIEKNREPFTLYPLPLKNSEEEKEENADEG